MKKSILRLWSCFGLLILVSTLTIASAHCEGLSTFPLGSTAPDIVLTDAGGKPVALAPYFEQNRILLLFVPDECTADATGYLSHLSSLKDALQERALQIVVVVNEHSTLLKQDFGPHVLVGSHSDYVATIISSNADGWPLSILIGKDKNVKLRERQFVPVKALFAKIDAMPMRKDEMRSTRKGLTGH